MATFVNTSITLVEILPESSGPTDQPFINSSITLVEIVPVAAAPPVTGTGIIPVVPTFVTADTSVLKLQQLAYAVSFISQIGVRPAWHFYKTGTKAIPAATWTAFTAGVAAYDSDGVYDNGSAKIVTTGYYSVEMCLQVINPAGAETVTTAFQIVAGASNPHHTSGTNSGFFGQRFTGLTYASDDEDTVMVGADICPWVLYPGDVVSAMIYCSVASTLDHNNNAQFMQGRFSTSFTGYFVRTGT